MSEASKDTKWAQVTPQSWAETPYGGNDAEQPAEDSTLRFDAGSVVASIAEIVSTTSSQHITPAELAERAIEENR